MSAPRVELISSSGTVASIHLALASCARTACGFGRHGVVSVEPVSGDCVRVTHVYVTDQSFTLLVDRDTWMGALRSQMS